jgi:hypothetical protein
MRAPCTNQGPVELPFFAHLMNPASLDTDVLGIEHESFLSDHMKHHSPLVTEVSRFMSQGLKQIRDAGWSCASAPTPLGPLVPPERTGTHKVQFWVNGTRKRQD